MNARTRSERFESLVQVLILLAIASMAAAASFTHVHNVAAAHGQPGWLAWADAVVLELMSIATGLEIRRRHRGGQAAGFVLWILIGAVVLSLSAQVVEAERSVVGWLAAALPAAGFLALVKIVLTRTPARTESEKDAVPVPVPPVPVVPATVRPVPAKENSLDKAATGDPDRGITPELLEQARSISAAHRAQHGRPITRDQLRTALGVATASATVVHRQIRKETAPARPELIPIAPGAFTRPNGTASVGGER
jgi:hypothetical protein